MSFEKIKTVDEVIIHERSCILMYYFTPQEAKQIMNVARMTGIKECLMLKAEESGCIIKDILDNKTLEAKNIPPFMGVNHSHRVVKEKAIIFNHIPASRMNLFIESLKKYRMKTPIMAVVTEQSIYWTLHELLTQLVHERAATRKGTFEVH